MGQRNEKSVQIKSIVCDQLFLTIYTFFMLFLSRVKSSRDTLPLKIIILMLFVHKLISFSEPQLWSKFYAGVLGPSGRGHC